jgi:hypothetical protein
LKTLKKGVFFTLILSVIWQKKGGKINEKSVKRGVLKKGRTHMVTTFYVDLGYRGIIT